MADEKKTAAGENPESSEAKKAPAKSAEAKKTTAKRGPARKPAARKPATGKSTPAKEAAESKPAAKPAPKPKPREEELVPVMVRASARYVRVAPRKARLVADQVRGLHIDRARALLDFSPRNAARDIRKLIDSAASNAENNHELVADDMRIAEIKVDEGPTLRRYRPRALGRATRINKRTSHISIALTPED
jgi:ribosomal protein L22